MNSSLLMVKQFLLRDFCILHKRVKDIAFDYGLLYPILYSISFGYILPTISGQQHNTTILYAGSIILIAQIIAFVFNLDFIFDLERNRFIEYQVTIIPAEYILLERIFLSTVTCFVLLLPYFPISLLVLGSNLNFSQVSWPLLLMQLLLMSWFWSALNFFGMCFIENSNQLENLWCRLFNPLFMLGGFQVPLATMAAVSPVLGYASYCNPVIYISEGIRSTILGGPLFIPYYICFAGSISFSILFTWLALYYFKRRIDHI